MQFLAIGRPHGEKGLREARDCPSGALRWLSEISLRDPSEGVRE